MARKLQDIRCTGCGEIKVDQYVDVTALDAHGCGARFERVVLNGRAAPVHGDDIPGGLEIRHGLCNADGSPRKFYSKSEIRRAAKEKGLSWGPTSHVTNPKSGSDKNAHTARWV